MTSSPSPHHVIRPLSTRLITQAWNNPSGRCDKHDDSDDDDDDLLLGWWRKYSDSVAPILDATEKAMVLVASMSLITAVVVSLGYVMSDAPPRLSVWPYVTLFGSLGCLWLVLLLREKLHVSIAYFLVLIAYILITAKTSYDHLVYADFSINNAICVQPFITTMPVAFLSILLSLSYHLLCSGGKPLQLESLRKLLYSDGYAILAHGIVANAISLVSFGMLILYLDAETSAAKKYACLFLLLLSSCASLSLLVVCWLTSCPVHYFILSQSVPTEHSNVSLFGWLSCILLSHSLIVQHSAERPRSAMKFFSELGVESIMFGICFDYLMTYAQHRYWHRYGPETRGLGANGKFKAETC